MTKASRDTQGRRKVKRGKKERKKERKGEERKGKRQVFPATNKRPGTHHRKRGVILSIKERKGEGREEGGLSSPQVPTNLKSTLTAVVTLCPAKVAGCFDRCGHVEA